MKNVLVTGGNGFLASWVIRKLLEKGYAVKTTIRSKNKSQQIYQMLQNEGVDTSQLSIAIADLTKAEDWVSVMNGIDYVIHTASPLGGNNHENPELVSIAKAGTEHVIENAIQAHVKKVVMTSSEAACYPDKKSNNPSINETYWTDLSNPSLTQYMISKIIAEQTAWNIINKQQSTKLVTILPGVIMGPYMNQQRSSTDQIFEMMLKGMPNTNVIFPIIDVRDLANLHILAMESNHANGHRFIAESNEMTMSEIADTVKHIYPDKKISSFIIPNIIVTLLAKLHPQIKVLNTMIGLKYHRDNTKVQKMLEWHPRPSKETVRDTITYLVSNQLI